MQAFFSLPLASEYICALSLQGARTNGNYSDAHAKRIFCPHSERGGKSLQKMVLKRPGMPFKIYLNWALSPIIVA